MKILSSKILKNNFFLLRINSPLFGWQVLLPHIHTTFQKAKIKHMLPYPKDTVTKYLIIRTETYKVILPGW